MWPKEFKFFIEFSEDLRTIFMFNTVKDFPEGITYYDLKKFGNIPHSKVYRLMKELAREGFLSIKDDVSKDTGRPKHLYFLTDKGENKSIELRQKIGKIFEFIKHRFPESAMDIDHEKFLKETNELFDLVLQRIQDETEHLYPLVRSLT